MDDAKSPDMEPGPRQEAGRPMAILMGMSCGAVLGFFVTLPLTCMCLSGDAAMGGDKGTEDGIGLFTTTFACVGLTGAGVGAWVGGRISHRVGVRPSDEP